MKLLKVGPNWRHWCPACNSTHEFAVDEPLRNGAKWSFDGIESRPTFNPSMNIRWGRYADPSCPDCTHGMAGQEVQLPHLPNRAMAR